MTGLKRTFYVCMFSALTLGATAVFAEDVAMPKDNTAVSSPQAKTEALPQDGFDLGAVLNPKPVNRSCTASTDCSAVGGTPIMCSGVFTCVWNASWVDCDNTVTYCTCNPANITSCTDPQGFCNCWNASPTNGWGNCRRLYCT